MKRKTYKKIQFDFSLEAVTRLDELVKFTHYSTRAELLRNSLRFFEYAMKKLNNGYRIKFEKDGEESIVIVHELK